MGGPRNGRTLRIALAISIAVHLTLASVVHASPVQALPDVTATRVIIHITVHPKPTPTPQRVIRVRHVAFQASQSVRPKVPRTHESRNHGAVIVAPLPQSTGGPPAPGNTGTTENGGATDQPAFESATPAPVCSDPNMEAKTLMAIAPEESASEFNVPADTIALIKVDLDATGRITGLSVYQSTGSPQLDRAAMDAARQSSYAPETRDCQTVAGSYLFKVEFSQ